MDIDEIKKLAELVGVNLGNPAALGAFLSGDIENAVAASTPGGIAAQEAAGQKALVSGEYLPKDRLPREQLEQLGFVFGKDKDDLFIYCQFPEGWHKEATDHSMWSKLVDPQGRERAMMFYKAAFYDRNAFMGALKPRYQCSKEYGAYPEKDNYDSHYNHFRAIDNSTGETLFHSEDYANYKKAKAEGHEHNWQDEDTLEKANRFLVNAWLTKHYPDYEDPLAYW